MGARIEDKYEAYKVQVNRRWDQRKANEDEYFTDDAGPRFRDFLVVAYGADRTAAQIGDRSLSVALSVRAGIQTSASREYRLQVRNAQTGELAIDAPHRVDIAFSQEDFGW